VVVSQWSHAVVNTVGDVLAVDSIGQMLDVLCCRLGMGGCMLRLALGASGRLLGSSKLTVKCSQNTDGMLLSCTALGSYCLQKASWRFVC